MATEMQTVTRPSSARTGRTDASAKSGEQRIVIRDLNWDLYDRLSDAIGDRQHIYLAYDGKDLELMTKGWPHEDYRHLFTRFVTFVTSELRIRSRAGGETTWKRPEVARGLEADQCYYFLPEKLRVIAAARRARPQTLPITPTLTWPSRSTFLLLRSTGLASMRRFG